jgi:hypothetical protein
MLRRALAISPVPFALAAVLLPWSVSGSSTRSAFVLVASLRGLGTVLPVWERIGLEATYALPVLAGCSLAAAVLGRVRISAAFGLALAVLVVATSIAAIVLLGPEVRLGPWVGVVGCSIALGFSLAAMTRAMIRHV